MANKRRKRGKSSLNKKGKAKISLNKYYFIAIGVAVAVVIILVLYFSLYKVDVKVTTDKILRCSDGTEYQKCSSIKPKYCLDGNIVDNPTTCGCPEGLVLAAGQCKNPADILPESIYGCKEVLPTELLISFGDSNRALEIFDSMNYIKDKTVIMNVDQKYCYYHPPAKAGENINVNKIFYCYGYVKEIGKVDSTGTVHRSYKINYDFTMSDLDCINISVSASGSIRKCKINDVTCNWNYLN